SRCDNEQKLSCQDGCSGLGSPTRRLQSTCRGQRLRLGNRANPRRCNLGSALAPAILGKNLALAPWARLDRELGSGAMLTAHQGTGRSGWFEGLAIGVVLVALLIGCGKDEGKIVQHWDGKTQLIYHSSLPKARAASKTDFKAVSLGGAKLNLTLPVNWKQQPQGRLHQWEWMWPLLRAHQDSKDKESLRRSIEIALDWIKENPLGTTKKQAGRAWLASAVAWRARALGYLIRAGAEAKVLNGDEFERLMLSAREHASWLSNDENYKMGTSHSL